MTTLLQMPSVGAVLRRIVQAYCAWGLVEYHTFAGKADRWYRSVKQHDTDTDTQRDQVALQSSLSAGKSHIVVYNEGLKSWLMIRWSHP